MTLDTESLKLIQDSAREWLAETCPVSRFRALRDSQGVVTGNELWEGLVELGWQGLMVPEEQGGSGLGMVAMGLILEQLGRNLAPLPLLSTGVIAVSALTLCQHTDISRDALAKIAGGDLRVALACDDGHHHQAGKTTTTAVRTDGGWLLSGSKQSVADAASADAFLISAEIEAGKPAGLFLVDAHRVRVEPRHLVDCRDHGAIGFADILVPHEALLAAADPADCLVAQVLDHARIGMAVEMLGCAWGAFEMTLEYLKLREQFGQLIGSFQALQHRAAKMYVDLELARSVVDAALVAVDNKDPDLPAIASRAKALVGETLVLVTNEAIQLHGGIGMTDEYDAGLFLKRARVCEHLYGNCAFHRDRFAAARGF